jgi:hypothetical protein
MQHVGPICSSPKEKACPLYKASQFQLTIDHVIKLSTWRLPQTSGYSYLRVAVIRIDVLPAGENTINAPHTLPTLVHVRPAYAFCGQSPYVATFHESSTELNRVTTPEKKCSRHNPQYTGWPIHGSAHSFSPEPTNEAVEKATHLSTPDY